MKMPYIQFYCRDWMGEQGLQRLGYSERGLWIELICLMATGDRYGYLTNGGKPLTVSEIARLTRGDPKEVKQLLDHLLQQNVYSVDEQGVIFSRRMVHDEHIRQVRAEAGKAGQAAKQEHNREPIISEPRTQSLPTLLLEQNFSEAWKSYPDKSGSKHKARQSFDKYRNEGDTQEQVLDGIKRYLAYVDHRRRNGFAELKYKNGQTFFNQRCWTSEWAIIGGKQLRWKRMNPSELMPEGFEPKPEEVNRVYMQTEVKS